MICMSAGGPKWGAHVRHAKRHKVCRTFALFRLTIEVSVLLSSRRYGCAFAKCKWHFARTSRLEKNHIRENSTECRETGNKSKLHVAKLFLITQAKEKQRARSLSFSLRASAVLKI